MTDTAASEQAVRNEVERTLEMLESWIANAEAAAAIAAAYADPFERSVIANRLYSLIPELERFSLEIWTHMEQEAQNTT